MFKPELYLLVNKTSHSDAIETLDTYSTKIKWNTSDNVIDLGCANGELTAILFEKLHVKSIVGCDISKKMVAFANEKYENNSITFKEFDLGGELLTELKEAFDHALSFYAIHWIRNQKKVFSNVYDMLKDGGDCLLVFPAQSPVNEFYRKMAQIPKWKHLLRNVNDYVSPYQDSQDPADQVTTMMSDIGFRNIEVKLIMKTYIDDIERYMETLESISPFQIPSDLEKQYMEDLKAVVEDLIGVPQETGAKRIKVDYGLLVAYGRK